MRIGSIILIFVMFGITVFVGLIVYDNMAYNNFLEKQNLGLISQNATWQGVLPSIPSAFQGRLLIVIFVVILFLIFVGIYEHYS